jgi:fluoride exporter
MRRLLIVALSGGVGSAVRYLLGGWIARAVGSAFPFGTITVNATGSFLIALVMTVSLAGGPIGPDLRLALTTGFMGGYTTYSTFNYESLALFQEGAWALGALNVLVTVVSCLALGACGVFLGRALVRA